MPKSLLIKSYTRKDKAVGIWHVLDEVPTYLEKIETGGLQDDISADSLNALISGIPTPWARALMFRYAFQYKVRNNNEADSTDGLLKFYDMIVSEWKGLITLMALYRDRITFSNPIKLQKEGDSGTYDIKGTFGEMLFTDKDLWSNQDELIKNPDEAPFIQLIKYKEQVVGATSPYSIVFTGVSYPNLTDVSDIRWYRNGRFEDPIKLRVLNEDQLPKLYLFVENLQNNLQKFEDKLNEIRIDKKQKLFSLKGYMSSILQSWLRDIEKQYGKKLTKAPIAKYTAINNPYKILFASEQRVYLKSDHTLTTTCPADGRIEKEIKDLQNFLKDDDYIMCWNDAPTKDGFKSLADAPVYYLRVNDPSDEIDPVKFFSLPLSLDAIEIYKNYLSDIDTPNAKLEVKGRITESDTLLVDVKVVVDGEMLSLNPKEYKIKYNTSDNKILLWPNFISQHWNKYYVYSEFPSNIPGAITFVPFFKDCTPDEHGIRGNFIKKQDGTLLFPNDILMADATVREQLSAQTGLDINRLVEYPQKDSTSTMHKYEIFRMNKPVAGLEIRMDISGEIHNLGYLIVKNSNDQQRAMIEDLSTANVNNDVTVGIDFGSNNSCIYHDGGTLTPVKFTNRRLALVGHDSTNSAKLAENDELLFFSNQETTNGQVKSWLHEHDPRYNKNREKEEVSGGVPVNKKNIRVNYLDDTIIETQLGKLNYNMKWLSEEADRDKKTSFLKTLWIQICADLYANKCKPAIIKWSYPGSMTEVDMNRYSTIFDRLVQATPVEGVRPRIEVPLTESEAVCYYTLSQDIGPDSSHLVLGIDVGGSTSDILILGTDKNRKNALLKQSSVRMAAGSFFQAIVNSAKFRDALYRFHESHTTRVHVENIKEITNECGASKAPFYLNSVFDQLQENEYSIFYDYISTASPFVFTLPSYITGILLYYAGMLVRKTLLENRMEGIKIVQLYTFGKGSRLFHWLQSSPGRMATTTYFEKCFLSGCGEDMNVKLKYSDDEHLRKDNKSEVAIGLVKSDPTVVELVYDSSLIHKSDVIGEKGVVVFKNGEQRELNEQDLLEASIFENINETEFPYIPVNFKKFLSIYIDFIVKKSGYINNIGNLENSVEDLSSKLKSFIRNDKEYQKAKKDKNDNGGFAYRYPIFLAEGACYLEKVLIPEIFKN